MSEDRPEPEIDLPADPASTVAPIDAEQVAQPAPPDLDLIEADLADVEVALERLDAGEYWRDEVTGEALDDAVLEQRPTTRRRP